MEEEEAAAIKVQQERDSLRAENERLKYRVNFLVRVWFELAPVVGLCFFSIL